MKYNHHIKKVLENVIWITGCARSGTTILGKILSTLKNVEYAYEPEFLFSLLPSINKINRKEWLKIYNAYIVEELLFNSKYVSNFCLLNGQLVTFRIISLGLWD